MTTPPTAVDAGIVPADSVDCAAALDLLQDYLKEEMGPELKTRLRAHLEHCRPCFHQAQFEQNFVALIAKAAGQCAPETVRARVLAALHDEPPAPPA